MDVRRGEIPGVLIIEPRTHGDRRGFFVELFEQRRYIEAGVDACFVQDNLSRSVKHTLRGLHYQLARPQAKLVMALEGSIVDVVVDLRPGSTTFGRSTAVALDGESKRQVFVPAGFAHGFCVTSEFAVVLYKCSDYYDPASEAGVIWNDPDLAIEWPTREPIVSAKDASLPTFARARLPAC